MSRKESGFSPLEPAIVSDVDEVIFDAATRHAVDLGKYAKKNGWDVVSKEDFFKKGGSHASYGNIPAYWALNDFMINDSGFNRDLDTIPDSNEALNFLAPHLLVYLTTRPESILRLTEEELEKNGFPKREVIARPKSVALKHTTEWKLEVLKYLAKEKSLFMIDDSFSLYQAIRDLAHPRIETILFKGLITPEHSEALNWRQIMRLPHWSQTLDSLNFPVSCESNL